MLFVLLGSLVSHYRGNFKEVLFEENILKCANEKIKAIFYRLCKFFLEFAFMVIVWAVC